MKNLLVTLQERQNHLDKGMVKKMGDIIKVKVIDLDKLAKQEREYREKNNMSMTIDVKKIREGKNITSSFSYSKDPETGIYYGIPVKTMPDGNIQWYRVVLGDFETYNLEQDLDMKKYLVLKMWSRIKNSPFEREPVYEIDDPEVEAVEVIDKASAIKLAIERSDELSGEPLVRFVRILGINVPKSTSEKVLRGQLSTKAINSPTEFNEKWTDADRGHIEIFTSAVNIGILRHDLGKGFFYNDILLGLNEQDCVAQLKDDINILNALVKELDRRDEVAIKIEDINKNDDLDEEIKKEEKKQNKKDKKVTEEVLKDNLKDNLD